MRTKSNNERVLRLKDKIQKACIEEELNLTVSDGKIAFVDQKARKIIALWTPKFVFPEVKT